MNFVRKHIESFNDEELKEILRREYLSKLTKYKKVDEMMKKKYGMTFEEFEKQNIVAKMNYNFEVERDAQEWEIAIDGIETMKRKLKEIES